METRKKRTRVIVSLFIFLGMLVYSLSAIGGNLEPSAPPGPTMKTLDEVEPRIPIPASATPVATFTISQSGSYYLTGNRVASGTGITVEANDVTIDLMGYSLIGGTGSYCGIHMDGRSNVEVRNGTVRNFALGVYDASYDSKQTRVINIRAVSNGTYNIYLKGRGSLVKDCTASGASTGIMAAANNITVTGNTVCDNQNWGIYVGVGCTVTDNTVYNNQLEGIVTGYGCEVIGNLANNNQGGGIVAAEGSTVVNNTASNNKSGISAGDGCTVSDNVARNNQGGGISAGDGCTVSGNTAYYNQKNGIYADRYCTVIGNTASQNNQSDTADYAGIKVGRECMIKGNTVSKNNQNNIYVEYAHNALEENLVTDSTNGIYFNSNGNFYANNRASINGTDYANTSGNTDGGGNVSF